jgi:hypothetical protein
MNIERGKMKDSFEEEWVRMKIFDAHERKNLAERFYYIYLFIIL